MHSSHNRTFIENYNYNDHHHHHRHHRVTDEAVMYQLILLAEVAKGTRVDSYNSNPLTLTRKPGTRKLLLLLLPSSPPIPVIVTLDNALAMSAPHILYPIIHPPPV
mmetsp:Transcript_24407/g.57863  ORF Transcript_24407/g.57863 Transcript_24407/m.57863 type:complete len:106 (-) Transcript_24407:49-366(-)